MAGKLVAVRLKKRVQVAGNYYNDGEVAGFLPEISKQLVDGGAAVYFEKTKKPVEAEEPKKEDKAETTESQPEQPTSPQPRVRTRMLSPGSRAVEGDNRMVSAGDDAGGHDQTK